MTDSQTIPENANFADRRIIFLNLLQEFWEVWSSEIRTRSQTSHGFQTQLNSRTPTSALIESV